MKTTTVTISKLGQLGDGLARTDDGRSIFIDRGLSGETLTVQPYKTKDGALRGRVKDIITPSPNRTTPPCPHYKTCGGCQMQHISSLAYQQWKLDKLNDILRAHIDPFDLPQLDEPAFLSPKTRRRVTMSALKRKGKVSLGFKERRSKSFTQIDNCLLLEKPLQAALDQIKSYLTDILKDGKPADLFMQHVGSAIDCVITGPVGAKGQPDYPVHEAVARLINETAITRISWRSNPKQPPELLLQKQPIYKTNGNLKVALSPQAFLQPSAEGETILAEYLMSALPDEAKKAADLFAGHGTFAGVLAQKVPQVDAYEGEEGAMNALQQAANQSGAKIKAIPRDLFKEPLTAKELSSYDFITLDPPRAGARKQCEEIAASPVPTITYISCNPASFAKDAKALIEGGYRLQSIKIVDQFTWSTHCELVSIFCRI